MEIKLNLNGLEATITVKDVAEAAQLLSTLSAKRPASHAGHVMQVAATPLSQSVAKVLTEQSATEIKDLMKKTAQILQGTTTAPLLAALAKSPEGLWDHEWKKHLKDGSLSLAPYLSRLSQACDKACDKAGLPRKAFMVKKTVVGQKVY